MKEKNRIVKINKNYYPQYYYKYLFGFIKGWSFYYEEDLLLNGIYTELIKNKVSFNNKKEAFKFIKKNKNE